MNATRLRRRIRVLEERVERITPDTGIIPRDRFVILSPPPGETAEECRARYGLTMDDLEGCAVFQIGDGSPSPYADPETDLFRTMQREGCLPAGVFV